jgi:hypothetical protein
LAFSASLAAPLPAPTDFENEGILLCDDASDAFGLLGSFSRPVFSLLSSVSKILTALIAFSSVKSQTYISALCGQTRANVQ